MGKRREITRPIVVSFRLSVEESELLHKIQKKDKKRDVGETIRCRLFGGHREGLCG